VQFLAQTNDIDKMVKQSERLVKESSDLVREQEQQKGIELIQDMERAEKKIRQVVD